MSGVRESLNVNAQTLHVATTVPTRTTAVTDSCVVGDDAQMICVEETSSGTHHDVPRVMVVLPRAPRLVPVMVTF